MKTNHKISVLQIALSVLCGVVLAIREDLQVPVKFVGVGEGIDDLQPFDPQQFADGLFAEE